MGLLSIGIALISIALMGMIALPIAYERMKGSIPVEGYEEYFEELDPMLSIAENSPFVNMSVIRERIEIMTEPVRGMEAAGSILPMAYISLFASFLPTMLVIGVLLSGIGLAMKLVRRQR